VGGFRYSRAMFKEDQAFRDQVAVYLDAMGAGRPTAVARMGGGLANGNFRVERADGPPLALKIWWNRDLTGAQLVAEVSRALWAAGVPTPEVLEGPGGRLIEEVDGAPWMLQRFVAGTWVAPRAAHLRAIGRALAELHAVRLPVAPPNGLAMGFALIDQVLLQSPDHPFVERLRSEAVELRASLPSDLPVGPIHGDLFPDNALMNGDSVAAILDFEEICIDILALDLAMAFLGCGYPDGTPKRELWEALLAGYETVRPLSRAEHDALPLLLRYATLSIATWRFDWFVLQDADPTQADRYLEMVSRLDCLPTGW
jgi:homoserine kinase type II